MKSYMKILRTIGLALFVTSPLVLGDDTDIYYGGFEGNSKPMVMLTLDLRSNLSSTQCTDVTASSCNDSLTDDLYFALDLMTSDGTTHTYGPDGTPDSENFESAGVVSKPSLVSAWTTAIATDSDADSKVRLFDVLRAAFQVIINDENVQKSGLLLGLMVMHEHTQGCAGPTDLPMNDNQNGCSNGAYVLKGFFDVALEAPRNDFFKRLAALPTPSNVGLPPGASGNSTWNGHSYQLKELYLEYYRYITGQDMYNGWHGYEDFNSALHKKNLSYTGNDSPYSDDTENFYVAPDPNTYGVSIIDVKNKNYISPFEKGDIDDWACSGLYIINTVFGTANQDADSDDALESSYPSGLGLANNPDRNDVIGELYDTDILDSSLGTLNVEGDQNVTSFVLADTTNNKQDGWADSGGTDFALSLGDGASIKASLEAVFDSIISRSSSLVSSSVPVNVFNRAETLDSSFLAIFQAESGARWPGNIKKLSIGTRTTTDSVTGETIEVIQIQDANGDGAFDSLDGQIKHSALTFWTDAAGLDVTPLDPDDLEDEEVSGKDGRSVVRGGSAQQIDGFNTNDSCYATGPGSANLLTDVCIRQLYTENPTTPGSLVAFDATDTLADSLANEILGLDVALDPNSAHIANAKTIIEWARGAIEVDGSLSTVTGQRWMMGDVLHGKPIPINYGDSDGSGGSYSRTNPNVRLVFGANDGWFRMVENTSSTGAQSGREVWGFMPNEVLGIQESLARNIAPSTGHPYGVDGEIAALVIDKDHDGNIENGNNSSRTIHSTTGEIGSGDKVMVFFGLRRGGNAYYAMDISNPDAAPELMWKITNTGDFSELGMTFGAPLVAYVNDDGTRKPVVIIGGGYNGGWNSSGTARIGKDLGGVGTADTVGNAIYVIDALTGNLIWKAVGSGTSSSSVYVQAGMTDSIPSTMALLDSDRNDTIDMAFVGDAGGNVWRVDLPEAAGTARWTATKLAALGGSTLASDRRFFHEPDLILAKDTVIESGDSVERKYIGVAITSGDRAHPKEDDVGNFMYLIKDDLITSGSSPRSTPFSHDSLTDITSLCLSGVETGCVAADLSNGWKLDLQASGEKGLSSPRTLFGTIYFNSYLPEGESDEGLCSIGGLGSGRSYAIALNNGSVPLDPNSPIPTGDLDSDLYPDPDERYKESKQEGIPGDPEFIAIDGELQRQDEPGSIDEIDGRFKWKTYWYERGVDSN